MRAAVRAARRLEPETYPGGAVPADVVEVFGPVGCAVVPALRFLADVLALDEDGEIAIDPVRHLSIPARRIVVGHGAGNSADVAHEFVDVVHRDAGGEA